MNLVHFTVAWIVGICLAHVMNLPPGAVAGLGVLALIGALCSRRVHRMSWIAVALLGIALGSGRMLLQKPQIDCGHLAYYNDRGWIDLEGFVSKEPSIRGTYSQLQISATLVNGEDAVFPVRGKCLVNRALYPRYEYGDRVRLSGILETPPILEGFDYREYLNTEGVHSLLRRAQIQPLLGSDGSSFLRALYRRKAHLQGVIASLLPEPEAGLLSGIILGLGHTLPGDLEDAFRTTGLAHLIVISGYNISLLMQAMILASRDWIHRWLTLCASFALIAIFGLFVGPSPPVVRAVLMGGLFIVGQLLGRPCHALTSLATASLLMTLANPLLISSLSFQLSLASTLALIVLQPWLARGLRQLIAGIKGIVGRIDAIALPRWLQGLSDIVLTTIAAQLATLPLLAYHLGQVSVIAPLANLLVLPIQPAIMVGGAATMIAGGLWLPVGRLAAWAVWPLLRYNVLVVERLAQLPWAAIEVSRDALNLLGVLGVVAASGYALLRSEGLRRQLGTILAQPRAVQLSLIVPTLSLVLISSALLTLPDGRLHVYALDVGQGDAILFRTPGGRTILVDGGPDPLLLTSRLGRILPPWQRRIDLVVATHADADHLAGLVPIVEGWEVGMALQPPSMAESPLAAHWRATLDRQSIPCMTVAEGTTLQIGESLELHVLSPPTGPSAAEMDDNQGSLVLWVVSGRCRILLTGDIDGEVEKRLLQSETLGSTTVLKVAHHGAESATLDAFLQAVDPQLALISVGAENRFGHPSQTVLDRLSSTECRTYRTDEMGSIEFITDGERYWIKFHDPRKR